MEIAATDLKAGRHWSSPAPVSPTLEELCDQLRGVAIAVEATSAELAPIKAPEVEEPTPTAEPILIEGSPKAVEESALAEAGPPPTEAPPIL